MGIGGASAPAAFAEAGGGAASMGANATAAAALRTGIPQPGADAAAATTTWTPSPPAQLAQSHSTSPSASAKTVPNTRAELLSLLRGTSQAHGAAAPRAAADARGGSNPTRPRPPDLDGDSVESRSIRRRSGDYSAAAMHADASARPRGDDGPAAAAAVAAREEGVSGCDAITVSARTHPVPSVVTAGVDAAAAVPSSADAGLAPARRRIIGKQRVAMNSRANPSAVVASDPHCRRDGALQLGRARTERPPG